MIIRRKNILSAPVTDNPIILFYGQSNGKGHDPLVNLPAQYQQTFANIKTFTGSSYESLNYLTNNNQWPEQSNTYGCEFSLMTKIQSYYGRNVFLSKPCFGGCGLAAGAGVSGDLTPGSLTSYYPTAAKLWGRAMNEACSTSVKAFIFVGGESDATATYEGQFQANLELMYTNVKSVLNLPNLPIIIVGVTNDLGNVVGKGTVVRAAMVSFVAADPTKRFFCPSESYAKESDGFHYVTAAYETMGSDLYNIMIANNLLT